MATSRADIDRVVSQIVERFDPRRIVLFGSHARNEERADSDVDLLVVMDTDRTPLHAAAHIAGRIDHPAPLDIVVRTPDTFAAQLANQSRFEADIQHNGITLYDVSDARVDSKSGRRPENRTT